MGERAPTKASTYAGGSALLSLAVAAAAYFDAWTYVNNPSGYSSIAPWQDVALIVAWLALTGWLFAPVITAIAGGRPWAAAVPPGYEQALVGCLGFGAVSLIDYYLQLVAGTEKSLDNLLSPTRIGQMVTAVLMVSGPVRAAWQRGDLALGAAGVVSAAMLLSALTFFTQFAHPFRDPWAGAAEHRAGITAWVLEDFGVTGILLQAGILAGFTLLLLRRFQVRPGSFTFIFLVNGALLVALKGHWEMLAVAAVTGLVADLLVWRLRPGHGVVALRLVAVAVPGTFALSYFLVLIATQGIWWDAYAWTGTVVSSAAFGWLLSFLVVAPTRRVPAAVASWPAHHAEITPDQVREALEQLGRPRELAESALGSLPFLAGRAGAGEELRELLIDIVREKAAARDTRDAEAGKILLEYYVKRSGTHEQVMERLHMSRQTYYRRLAQRAWPMVAERLDELREYALVHPPEVG